MQKDYDHLKIRKPARRYYNNPQYYGNLTHSEPARIFKNGTISDRIADSDGILKYDESQRTGNLAMKCKRLSSFSN